MLERLQKIISAAGITSRRASEEMILAGRVTVNDVVVTELGSKADPARDRIAVDGRLLKVSEERVYLMLNKPTGYITALKDSQGRPLVTELLKDVPERVYPVGRLDYNTEGILLLTNDGEWANRLMHPRHEVEKEYHVRVRGKVADQQLRRLAEGVELEDGMTAPAVVRLVKSGEHNDWISVAIHEGRNRQVRRMCEAVSLSVVRLKRIRYGSLELGSLRGGHYRYLTEAEVQRLAGTPPAAAAPKHEKKAGAAGGTRPARPQETRGAAPRERSAASGVRERQGQGERQGNRQQRPAAPAGRPSGAGTRKPR